MNKVQTDKYCLEVAKLCAKNSYAKKLQVGAVIVKNHQIISDGFNGTPCGFKNECEIIECTTNHCHKGHTFSNYALCFDCKHVKLITKPEVLHAESNAILKCAKYGKATNGSTLYITHSPCIECAKLIIQAGIKRVVYLEDYRKSDGLELLKKVNIVINKLKL